jgi:alpha-amylase
MFLLLVCASFTAPLTLPAQDVIMQGFYWDTHPGDHTDAINGGIWWDTLATVAPELAGAGFATVWTPPMTKGFGGRWDMGYGLYDYYDLGEYDQKFTTRTRHGNRAQLDAMIVAMHSQGLNVMADAVLNHRGGADGQQAYEVPWGNPGDPLPYTIFNPLSGRFPGVPGHFHPNNAHNDQNGDYRNPIFFEDVCYFNDNNDVPPPGGWYFGVPDFGLGHAADSLIAWGRWLINDVGFDELRLDAVKHINPDFLSKFLVETRNGIQPFAVGEFFDSNGGTLASYQSMVETNGNNGGIKSAEMSIFDFELRDRLKGVLDNTTGSSDLYNAIGRGGMVWGHGASGFDVVTFLDNHDKDRVGFRDAGVPDMNGNCDPGEIQAGNSCLVLGGSSDSDHDPIINDKEDMGYPLLMAAEGRPTVFWKDWYWFGLSEQIKWLMALREATAIGGSSTSSLQNEDADSSNDPVWDSFGFGVNCNGGNLLAMQRWGLSSGTTDGMVLGLNDHPNDRLGMYVNTPFSQKTLKDYSDGFMFISVNAPGDSRTLIQAEPRDYAWWSLTGLYPHPPEVAAPAFEMDAAPGGQVHFVVVDADDVANLLVDGAAIEAGDQLAIVNASNEVCGIGRVGQEFGWKPGYDMLIEAIGAFPNGDPNGLVNGETFGLVVFDASAGQYLSATGLAFATVGSGGTFNALRPQTPNRSATFAQPSTNAEGTYTSNGISNGISRLTQFDASSPATAFPVEWTSLRVAVDQDDATLHWGVAQEVNNEGFEVQLHRPGTAAGTFEAVGFVPGRGMSQEAASYSYRVSDLVPGTYLFRLRQVDLDGQASFSRQVTATINQTRFSLSVYPNPAGEQVSARIQVPQAGTFRIACINAAGQTVWQDQRTLSAGTQTLAINLKAQPSGLYVLRIDNGRQLEVQQVWHR